MPIRAVFFDIGETLVDETRWGDADAAGVPRFTFFGVLGGLAARGEQPPGASPSCWMWTPGFAGTRTYTRDALPCLRELRGRGYRVGAVGNTPGVPG